MIKTLLRVSLELVEDDFGALTVRVAEKSHRGELHGETNVVKEMLLDARTDFLEYCLEQLRHEIRIAREHSPVDEAQIALRTGRVPRDWMEGTERWEPGRLAPLSPEEPR